MSILSDFEDRVGRAIEGVFAGVFRAPVQPAELARAAAKEMDRRRKLGVGKVYAPTMYSILLSPADGEMLGGFAKTLAGELETYLRGYAHERDYQLTTKPRVRFLVDDELKLGRFEVIGELLSPEQIATELGDENAHEPSPDEATPSVHPIPAPTVAPVPAEPLSAAVGSFGIGGLDTFAPSDDEPAIPDPTPVLATVTVPGVAHDVILTGDRVSVGRLASCGVCLSDVNVSREHAAFEREGTGWAAVDLGSTNGTLVNGERVGRRRLTDGDIVTVGITELVYHEPRG